MKLALVVPGLNEEKYLADVFSAVQPYRKKHLIHEVIFVDDGSTDSTAAIAKKHTDHVLQHEINLGKGAALLTGCLYAFDELKADAVLFMDADNQHNPAEIPHFVEQLESGADLVFGVRKFGADMPLLRFLGNKCASVFLAFLFGEYIPDIPSGYKALTKKGFKNVRWTATGYEVEAEIAVRTARSKLPFSIIEIETIYHDTNKGMTLLDALRIGKKLLQWKLEL